MVKEIIIQSLRPAANQAALRRAEEELRRERDKAMIERRIAKRRENADRECVAVIGACAAEEEREAQRYADRENEELECRNDETRKRDLEERRKLMLDAVRGQIEQIRDRDERRGRGGGGGAEETQGEESTGDARWAGRRAKTERGEKEARRQNEERKIQEVM